MSRAQAQVHTFAHNKYGGGPTAQGSGGIVRPFFDKEKMQHSATWEPVTCVKAAISTAESEFHRSGRNKTIYVMAICQERGPHFGRWFVAKWLSPLKQTDRKIT
jgi:hypothetical protein